MTRRSLVGALGCVVVSACGGVIDGNSLDAGPDAIDAAHPFDAGLLFDVSVGPADSSVTRKDSTAPADTGVTTIDATVGFDVSAQDVTTLTCSQNSPFTPILWAPPTRLHQAVCTPAQTMAYINSLQSQNGPWTSGNAACDGCLQTDEKAPAHGPIVTQLMMGKEAPAELNYGGCVANFDGMKAAGGCGNKLNNNSDCINQECFMCSDINMPTPGGPTEMCTQQIEAPGGVCASDTVPAACSGEVSGSGDAGILACVGQIQEILDLWCGH